MGLVLAAGLTIAIAGVPALHAAISRRADPRSAPVPAPACPQPAPGAPSRRRRRDVSARWTPDGPDGVSHVDPDLPAGRKTVITGASGSGQTTLAALFGRCLDPVAGTVSIN